jgi:hypothetical protein
LAIPKLDYSISICVTVVYPSFKSRFCALHEGILIWCQDEDGKCMLLDGEPKPSTVDLIRMGRKLKSTFGFIKYYKFWTQS